MRTWMLALGLLTMTLPSFASDGGACKDDIQKFCSDVDASDHHAIGACLKNHKDDVSADCKTQMAKHHKKKADATTPPPTPAAPQ